MHPSWSAIRLIAPTLLAGSCRASSAIRGRPIPQLLAVLPRCRHDSQPSLVWEPPSDLVIQFLEWEAMELYFALLQRHVLDRQRWATRDQLRLTIVT